MDVTVVFDDGPTDPARVRRANELAYDYFDALRTNDIDRIKAVVEVVADVLVNDPELMLLTWQRAVSLAFEVALGLAGMLHACMSGADPSTAIDDDAVDEILGVALQGHKTFNAKTVVPTLRIVRDSEGP